MKPAPTTARMPGPSEIRPPTSAFLGLWPWAAATASGLLLTACFPPWNQSWLCWFALTPLLCALFFAPVPARRFLPRQAALGYVTGFVFIGTSFYWLSTTLAALYDNPWLYALAPLVALVLGLYYALWACFLSFLVRPRGERPLFPFSLGNLGYATAGAGAWIVHEWLRERVFGGFGWNPLGVALHRDLPMIQIAEFTGAPGLSFLVVFANLMAVIIVRRILGELGPVFVKRIRWEFSVTMALIAAVFAFGLRRLLQPTRKYTVPLRIVAVQPNTPQEEKFDRDAEEKVLAQLDHLTSLGVLAAPPPHLVLWPESAVPSGMFASKRNFRFVIDQFARGDFALLLGTVDFDMDTGEDFNAALLLTQRGQEHQTYRKIHLVPFGEYLPLRPLFAGFVGQLVPGDFTPGREHRVLQLPEPAVKLAALVCFEDTLGDLTARFVKGGAQALVNLTNDGWFARSPAAEQHLANAALRAVENRRPLIRCGNTGVTCAIRPTGHIDRWLPPFQQGFAAREVSIPTQPRLTFYTRHGNWLCAVGAALTLLAGALAWRRQRAR